jgi:hypothetical protein
MSSYKDVISKMLEGEYDRLDLMRRVEDFNLALRRVPNWRVIPYDPMKMAH